MDTARLEITPIKAVISNIKAATNLLNLFLRSRVALCKASISRLKNLAPLTLTGSKAYGSYLSIT